MQRTAIRGWHGGPRIPRGSWVLRFVLIVLAWGGARLVCRVERWDGDLVELCRRASPGPGEGDAAPVILLRLQLRDFPLAFRRALRRDQERRMAEEPGYDGPPPPGRSAVPWFEDPSDLPTPPDEERDLPDMDRREFGHERVPYRYRDSGFGDDENRKVLDSNAGTGWDRRSPDDEDFIEDADVRDPRSRWDDEGEEWSDDDNPYRDDYFGLLPSEAYAHPSYRRYIAWLIETLTKAGVRAIVLRLPLSMQGEEAAADAELVRAIEASGRVHMVGLAETIDLPSLDSEFAPSSSAPGFQSYVFHVKVVPPLLRFVRASQGWASEGYHVSDDGFLTSSIMWPMKDLPHVSILLAQLMGKITSAREVDDGLEVVDPGGHARHVPLDSEGWALLNPTDPRKVESRVVADILPPPAGRSDTFQSLEGRVVLVEDMSYDSWEPGFQWKPRYSDLSGLPLHRRTDGWLALTTMENLVNNRFLDPAPPNGAWLLDGLLVVFTILVGCLRLRWAFLVAVLVVLTVAPLTPLLVARGVLLRAGGVIAGLLGILVTRGLSSFLERYWFLSSQHGALESELARIENDLLAEIGSDGTLAKGVMPRRLSSQFIRQLVPERYLDMEFIGEGGMGLVFKAKDMEFGDYVALKIMSPLLARDMGAIRRFLLEARTLQGLDHPCLVKVRATHSELYPSFSMEFVKGRSIDRILIDEGAFDPVAATRVARDVAKALGYVHGKGIIHRDIKPSNILILENGTIKLLDFGVARQEGRTAMTGTGNVVGTFSYMPPEQAYSCEAFPSSDVYSLGLVLCEMILGRELERRGVGHELPAQGLENRSAPPALIDLIARTLEAEPKARPQDGAAIACDLDLILSDEEAFGRIASGRVNEDDGGS